MKSCFRSFFISVSLLLGILATAQAQTRAVKGRVLDDKGGPVIGATIVVKNAPSVGTISSETGDFSLSVPNSADSLVITAIGYTRVAVGVSDNVNVTLQTGSALDEVVVVGYGTQRKGDLTAPITTVNTENLLKRTTSGAMEGLQGAAPGLQIINNGAPGAAPNVRVRGIGSFNNENPLYVVDGMFVNDIQFLNPNDIESMSILKDASAAAIYGVRAANGVVLITTKKGKLNMKTRVTYNGYVGMQVPTNVLKMANGEEFTRFALGRMSARDSGTIKESVSRYGGSGLNPTTSTDWYGELLRKSAIITNHGIDVQGGSDKITYSLGFNYLYQDGIMNAKNSFERYNVRFQLEAQAFPWLKVGLTSLMTNSTQFNPNAAAFSDAYSASPLFPVYDEANVNAFPVKFAAPSVIGRDDANPVASAYYNYNRYKNIQFLPSMYAEASMLGSKLTFRTQYNTLLSSGHGVVYGERRNLGPGTEATVSNLRSQMDRNTNYIWDNLLTYRDGAGKHHWSVLVGQSVREERWRQMWSSANNVPNVPEQWYVTQGDRTAGGYDENGSRNAGMSYFSRATYDYDGRYLLTATYRADGSSKYQQKWGYFPSVGLGWVISKEAFMQDQKIFDFLKLRASWGRLGNDGVTPNADYAIVNRGLGNSSVYGSTAGANGALIPGYTVTRYFTALTWETVEEWDGGIDFEMFNNRLSGSVDYFHRRTIDAALTRPLGFTYGSVYGNWATMDNSGWDVQLAWKDRIGELNFEVGGNFGTLKNRVTDLGTIPSIIDGMFPFISEFPNRTIVGAPIRYFYGYEFDGIYQTADEIAKDPIASAYNAANPGTPIRPGWPKYKDQNGNGELDNEDRVNIGSYLPKVTYGFNLALNYKKVDFSIAFQGVSGNKILNLNRGKLYKASNSLNIDKEFAQNMWTGPGSTNEYPSAAAVADGWFKVGNSFFVENGSYLRIQNIQLGYNFSLGKDSGVGNFRVFATADRPFIFTKYNGFTPEVPGTGYDMNVYPIAATYSLGVRASF